MELIETFEELLGRLRQLGFLSIQIGSNGARWSWRRGRGREVVGSEIVVDGHGRGVENNDKLHATTQNCRTGTKMNMPRPDLTWKNHRIVTLTILCNILWHIWTVSELLLKVKAEANLQKHGPRQKALEPWGFALKSAIYIYIYIYIQLGELQPAVPPLGV